MTKDDLSAISQLLDSKLDSKLDPIKSDIQELKEDVQTLYGKANVFENDIQSIKLTMKNVVQPQLRLLAENYVPAAKRYEKASAQIETMQADIEMLKKVTADHSEKLLKIS